MPPEVADVYQEFFTANSLCVIGACLLLVWVSWQSHREHRLTFLKYWAASWSAYLLARVLTLLQIGPIETFIDGWLRSAVSTVSQAGYYVHVWLLMLCLWTLVRGREMWPSKRAALTVIGAITIAAFTIAVATAESAASLRMLLRVGVRCAITAVAFAICGVLLLRHGRRIKRLGARVVGATLLCGAVSYGLHAYAFGTGGLFDVASYLASFEILVVSALGLGLVLWMHENVNVEAISINRELGERTQALLQAQRLESIGQLAGGIAHDFNNVLTVVIGNSESLLRNKKLDPGLRSTLEETQHAAMQAAKMTGQLLTLARNPASAVRAIDVGREVKEIWPLLRSLAGARIEVTVHTPNAPLRAQLKRGHVEQVLINLVTNGRDAISDAGSIRIEVRREVHDGQKCVVLAATDSGTGMSESVQERVGELFFTTKGGRGTGMGMASVRSILAETDGSIQVESDRGEGARVTVSWPEVDATSDVQALAPTYELPRVSGARILFAEDDPMVRNVTCRTLESAGFEVLVSKDATEAERIAREHSGPIHLLLSDVVMPGLSGPELAAEVKKVRPQITVRFISGYVDDEHSARLSEMAPVLGKPFTRQELLSFVESALADPSGRASGAPV